MKDIQWLFFDIGSTIIDETLAYSHRYQDIARMADVPYPLVREMAEMHFRCSRRGDKETARHFGVPLPQWHTEEERLYPEAAFVLHQLHSRYKLGIIANQVPGTRERLRAHNILDCFDLILASAEEGCAKPDLKIFETALQRSHCHPQNAVMIGDRIDNDIVPARRLGMKTIWIKQGYGKYWTFFQENETPDFTVCSLSELPSLL